MVRKTSKGRQRIRMEKIQSESSLLAAFSKRRSILMEKANDLCTLTGSDIALIIFSPASRVFSFGNQSVESVIHRFKFQTPKHESYTPIEKIQQTFRHDKLHKLNHTIMILEKQLKVEKTNGDALDEMLNLEDYMHLWEDTIEVDLNLDQLEKMKASFNEINELARVQMSYSIQKDFQKADVLRPGVHIENFQVVSSSSNGGIDLNHPLAHGFDSFAEHGNAINSAYGPEF